MNKNKTNTKHTYLRSKRWKQTHTPYRRNIMWTKGVHIENTQQAYELQQKWDEEEKNQHKEVL